MKEKIKRGAVDLLKILAIAVVIFALCVSAPYCKGLLGNHNYVVVTDGISAEQSLTKTNSRDVLVEFRCPSDDFPRLLAKFIENHKQLDFKMVETLHSEDSSRPKGFVATFMQN